MSYKAKESLTLCELNMPTGIPIDPFQPAQNEWWQTSVYQHPDSSSVSYEH